MVVFCIFIYQTRGVEGHTRVIFYVDRESTESLTREWIFFIDHTDVTIERISLMDDILSRIESISGDISKQKYSERSKAYPLHAFWCDRYREEHEYDRECPEEESDTIVRQEDISGEKCPEYAPDCTEGREISDDRSIFLFVSQCEPHSVGGRHTEKYTCRKK
jgi:hypothetical protein